MTKTKKIVLAITVPICAILLAIMIYLSMLGIATLKFQLERKDWTALDYCENRWDIDLPDECEILYNYIYRDDNNDVRYCYTVCSFSTRPDEFLESFGRTSSTIKTVGFYNEIVESLTDKGIDMNYVVDINTDTMIWRYKRNQSFYLALAYDNETNLLYIAEKPFVR